MRSFDRARITALLLAVAGSAIALPAHAQHLGVIGPVYPIAEPSLLALIQSKLRELAANGGLERLQRDSQARIRRQIEEPAPVAGLTRTATARSFHFDPSIEVPHPISDAEGRLIVAPGTRVNPLDVVSLSHPLFVFDARDAEQVERARRELADQRGQVKLILTGGSYLELMRRWKQTVYYDQQGLLTTRLGIRQVPARVTQDGRRLRIDELR
jgi:conjugal transfer pilus assembly protein TraW